MGDARHLVALILVAACSSSKAPPSSSPAPTPGSSATGEAPYRCTADTDCLVSCAYGAVNRAWYEAAKLQECKDGCSEDNTARCRAGSCVAVQEGGSNAVDTACTHRPITPP